VRLASQLTGWDIDILTEAEESERRQAEFKSRSELFQSALDVDEMIAQLLTSEGFRSVEDIAYVALDELAEVEGFDADTAAELQARARNHLDEVNAELDEKRKSLGVADDLAAISGLSPKMLVTLGEKGIRTLDDFGDLSTDELIGGSDVVDGNRVKVDGVLEGFDLTREQAEEMIMAARAHWFAEGEAR
jgi:N utilization substance protein A